MIISLDFTFSTMLCKACVHALQICRVKILHVYEELHKGQTSSTAAQAGTLSWPKRHVTEVHLACEHASHLLRRRCLSTGVLGRGRVCSRLRGAVGLGRGRQPGLSLHLTHARHGQRAHLHTARPRGLTLCLGSGLQVFLRIHLAHARHGQRAYLRMPTSTRGYRGPYI